MFEIKAGYHLLLLTPGRMELLGTTKSRIIKVEKSKNVPYLEIAEVALKHCNVVNNNYQKN